MLNEVPVLQETFPCEKAHWVGGKGIFVFIISLYVFPFISL